MATDEIKKLAQDDRLHVHLSHAADAIVKEAAEGYIRGHVDEKRGDELRNLELRFRRAVSARDACRREAPAPGRVVHDDE